MKKEDYLKHEEHICNLKSLQEENYGLLDEREAMAYAVKYLEEGRPPNEIFKHLDTLEKEIQKLRDSFLRILEALAGKKG